MKTPGEPWYFGYNDKVLHLLVGFIVFIAALSTHFFTDWSFHTIINIALSMSLLAGVLKETYDVFVKKSRFDILDMLATWAGGIIPYITIRIIENLLPQKI